ncbi:MAG TPA: hypothetical protein ENH82_17750 [bacterium]|nr:hypothetical protein [bacterium]
MSKETGGAAFPGDQEREKAEGGHYIKHDTGMTLRDYFAAKAMQGILALGAPPTIQTMPEFEKLTANRAYKMADALIAERGNR